MEMKLYVIDSPYWFWSMRPQGENQDKKRKSSDPLDEHHTFFYYQFLRCGLVDEVVVYDSHRCELNSHQDIPVLLEFPEGNIRVEYDSEKKEVSSTISQLVYCRQHQKERYSQHIRLTKSILEGFPNSEKLRWLPFYIPFFCKKRTVKLSNTDIYISEGYYNSKYIHPSVKSIVWPSLSNQAQYVEKKEKKYDWIMVSSLHPYKRLIGFCQLLIKNKLSDLRGCILIESSHAKNKRQKSLTYLVENIVKKINIDIHYDLTSDEKMKMLCQSRVYVSPSSLDSGPRSLIEAAQAEIPILALKHHGCASYIIKPGVNGEWAWRFSQLPKLLQRILSNYNSYNCSINASLVDPVKCFEIVKLEIERQIE